MELSSVRVAEEALKYFSTTIRSIIQSVEQVVADKGVEEFTKKNLGMLLGMFKAYEHLWRACESGSEQENLEFLKHISISEKNNLQFQETLEDFFNSEVEYDNLLDKLDTMLNPFPNIDGNILDFQLQTLADPDSRPNIRDIVEGSNFTWMVFLRHFAWLPWRDHVASLIAANEV